MRVLRVSLGILIWLVILGKPVWAAPYFYIEGPGSMVAGVPETYYLLINPDGNNLNAVRTEFNIPNGYFSSASIDMTDNRSPTPTPLYGTPPPSPTPRPAHRCDTYAELSTTPDTNGDVIVTCGFKNPNVAANGAFVARIVLTANNSGNINLAFDNLQSYFATGPGIQVAAGTSTNKSISIIGAGTPTPTPTGTLTPSPTPTSTPTSTLTPTPTTNLSATPTPTPTGTSLSGSGTNYGLSASDVNFVTIAPFPTPTPGTNDPLEVVEEDNTVPTPPAITPRPPATPFPTPDPNNPTGENGEVLAVQSIRDLLIPGKSKADKNVVLFNFISLLTLLTIIIIIIWRIMMLKRKNKLKQEHIAELISGELATLESKLAILEEKDGAKSFQMEFEQTLGNIQEELAGKGKVKSTT